MFETVACDHCGNHNSRLLFAAQDYISRRSFDVVECLECGLVYTNPRPQTEEIESFYGAQYYGQENIRFSPPIERVERWFRRRRAYKILKFKSTGRILDVGCGRGEMLAEFRKLGWDTYGTELNDQVAQVSKDEFGLDVRPVKVEEWGFADQYFDVVTLWHALEHLSNPRKTLSEVKRILKDDGVLVVAVPNIGGLQARISKRSWFHLDVPRHYYHFSTSTLIGILESVGFTVIETHHMSWEYDPYGWIQSMFNIVSSEPNHLYIYLRGGASNSARDRLRKLSFMTAYLFLAVPAALWGILMSLITAGLRAGSTIEVIATKADKPNSSIQVISS